MAKGLAWAGVGETKVWKLRYRSISNALTVPSSDALTNARPCGTKLMSLTGAVCSVKVTKQKPEAGDQSFTYESVPFESGCHAVLKGSGDERTLLSPPPVAMIEPPGE